MSEAWKQMGRSCSFHYPLSRACSVSIPGILPSGLRCLPWTAEPGVAPGKAPAWNPERVRVPSGAAAAAGAGPGDKRRRKRRARRGQGLEKEEFTASQKTGTECLPGISCEALPKGRARPAPAAGQAQRDVRIPRTMEPRQFRGSDCSRTRGRE